MLSRATSVFARRISARSFTTVADAATADDALKFSGYSTIDFTIKEDVPVYDAVQKFAAFNIGCLVTVDGTGTSVMWIAGFVEGQLHRRKESIFFCCLTKA